MELQQGLSLADHLICDRTGHHISTLQTEIFRGAWQNQTYETIAEKCYCSEAHIKFVGKSLWDLLSQSLSEKVTKKNFRAALERKHQQQEDQLTKEVETESETIPVNTELEKDSSKLINPNQVELELPEGQVKLGSVFYVERPPIENICYQTILKPGSLIRIKAPKQMGKSSLMTRILEYAAQKHCHTVVLDLRLADSKIFKDLDLFLRWFGVSIGRKLSLPNQIEQYWDDLFGSKTCCTDYFENYLLAKIEPIVVLAIEEIDRIFSYGDLADDFYGLLRAWHEEGKNNHIWQKLHLVLVHSTEVYLPLDINQSPFNVGLAIELPEFTADQVLDLAQRHNLDWNSENVQQLMAMIGGHPYLVRVALYHLAQKNITLQQFLEKAPTEAGFFSNHLRRQRSYLKQQPQLALAMKQVIEASSPIRLDSTVMFKLHSMGLISVEGNEVTPRCQLYRQYFANYN